MQARVPCDRRPIRLRVITTLYCSFVGFFLLYDNVRRNQYEHPFVYYFGIRRAELARDIQQQSMAVGQGIFLFLLFELLDVRDGGPFQIHGMSVIRYSGYKM